MGFLAKLLKLSVSLRCFKIQSKAFAHQVIANLYFVVLIALSVTDNLFDIFTRFVQYMTNSLV